jgi:hypothetical protein
MALQRRSRFVTGQEASIKKSIVRLSTDERERLNAMINIGKHPARKPLKADISAAGEGWSDSRIAAALDTSTDTVLRTRQRLVEEGEDGRAGLQIFTGLGPPGGLPG